MAFLVNTYYVFRYMLLEFYTGICLYYHIDLEKAYDKVPRNIMWWALEKHKIPTKYITLIKDMYKDVTTFVRTCDGNTTDFPINIGLHHGSALSPYLFAFSDG